MDSENISCPANSKILFLKEGIVSYRGEASLLSGSVETRENDVYLLPADLSVLFETDEKSIAENSEIAFVEISGEKKFSLRDTGRLSGHSVKYMPDSSRPEAAALGGFYCR